MKVQCPVCKGPATRLTGEIGNRHRYRCDLCGNLSEISSSLSGGLLVASILLVVIPTYWLAKQLELPRFSELFVLLGLPFVHDLLVTRFGTPTSIGSTPAPVPLVAVAADDVGFLKALGIERTLKMLGAMNLFISVSLLSSFDSLREDWLMLTVAVGGWVVMFAPLFVERCPSCRGRLMAPPVRAWLRVLSIKVCPQCGFRPTPIVPVTQPSKVRNAMMALGLVALLAFAIVPFRIRSIHELTFPPLSDPGKGAARLDWSLEDLQGRKLEAASFRGKVILLNLWATWCRPCRHEMPSIAELHEKLGDEIVIACVSKEPLATLREFADEHELAMPLYKIEESREDLFADIAFPTTYIIDATGRYRFKHVGAADWSSEKAVQYLHALATQAPEDATAAAAPAPTD